MVVDAFPGPTNPLASPAPELHMNVSLHSGWQPGMASSAAPTEGLGQGTCSLSISSAVHQELLCGSE